MTKVALSVDDDSMAPTFQKGDVIIVDTQSTINTRLTISQIIGKDITFAPINAPLSSPVTGKLVSIHRHF